MIFKIDLQGTEVLENFPSIPRRICGNVGNVLNRQKNKTQADGFLWARIDTGKNYPKKKASYDKEAINQVQDLVLCRMVKDLDVSKWSSQRIKAMIKTLKS